MRSLFRTQQATEVLVREPARGTYNYPEPAASYAPQQWEYAAMSSAAYDQARFQAGGAPTTKVPNLPGWRRWTDFPSNRLLEKLKSSGLYVDVWEREEGEKTIAVIFEGTNFTSMRDWQANFRWFLRFLPSFEDQYTIAADEVAREFYERLARTTKRYRMEIGNPELLSADDEGIRIVSAGHSLGGGLAQHFAYAFPQPYASGGPKVSEVYAFDASPVTGWTVLPRGLRTYNAKNLRIHRIFEHGEVLAYLRLITSRFSRYSEHPSVWEYRYNFDSSWNMVQNHSMHRLSEGLTRAANGTQ